MAERRCAYCGRDDCLTREHIWPRCIIERTPEYNARFHGKTGTFFGGELTVKDVCATCNSGQLGALDEYICGLYDAQLNLPIRRHQSVLFWYDYRLLLRWLLKISFNSARANISDVDVLRRYAKYVLHGGEDPSDIAVHVELVYPAKNPRYRDGTSDVKYIPPRSVRCCRVETSMGSIPGMTLRLVAVNAFYFWVLISSLGTQRSQRQDEFVEQLPHTVLKPNKTQVRLTAKGRNALDAHRDWVLDPRARESMARFRARDAG